MRVIAGTFRGKKLNAPEGETTRPTSDRAREMVFDILAARLLKQGRLWRDVSLADAFAGSGAMAAEALSRGAREVFCFETDHRAVQCLNENMRGWAGVHLMGDALTPPPHAPISVLFMDAPYGRGLWQRALPAFLRAGWIDDKTVIIIETDAALNETLPADFTCTQTRAAGRNTFLFGYWNGKEP